MFRNLIMSFCLLQSQGSTKPASTKPASTKPASTKPTSTKSTTTKNTKSKCSTKSNRKFAAQKLHFSTANKSKATAEVVLVVEDSEDSDVDITEPSSQKTKWVQSMSRNDRAILLSPVAWLNDNNVTAAQILLKSQTSCGGLQQPTLGQSLGFDIMQEEFVQVLHDGHSHWLTLVLATKMKSLFMTVFTAFLVRIPRTKLLPCCAARIQRSL